MSQPVRSWSTRAWGCSPAPRSFWGPSPGPTEPPPAPRVSSLCPPSPSHVGMGPRYDPTEHLPCPCCFAPSCRHCAPPRAPFSLRGEQGRGPPAPTPPCCSSCKQEGAQHSTDTPSQALFLTKPIALRLPPALGGSSPSPLGLAPGWGQPCACSIAPSRCTNHEQQVPFLARSCR